MDPDQVSISKNTGNDGSFRAFAWVACGIIALAGLVQTALAEGWRDQLTAGRLMFVTALVVMPPVRDRIQVWWKWTRPAWVPVVFAGALIAAAQLTGSYFAPSLEEQLQLRSAALVEAERLFAEGDGPAASRKLRRFVNMPDPDHRVANLERRIREARSAARVEQGDEPPSSVGNRTDEGGPDPNETYVERVQTHWLAQLAAIPESPPATIAEYGQRLTSLDAIRQNLADGQALNLNRTQRAIHDRFASALAAKQRALFPGLRRGYGQMLAGQLFRSDVLVTVSGRGADTIRLTGPMFVRNANIEDMQAGLASDLARARFRRIEFRWSRNLNEGYHYDLQPPADADITAR